MQTLYLNAGSLGSCFVPEILHLKPQFMLYLHKCWQLWQLLCLLDTAAIHLKQQSMLYLNAGSSGGCFVPEKLHLKEQSMLYLNAGSCCCI
jgi:hypothetical protein